MKTEKRLMHTSGIKLQRNQMTTEETNDDEALSTVSSEVLSKFN